MKFVTNYRKFNERRGVWEQMVDELFQSQKIDLNGSSPSNTSLQSRNTSPPTHHLDPIISTTSQLPFHDPPPISISLDCENVSFSPSNTSKRSILNQVNLTFPPSSLSAIMGPSGSGFSFFFIHFDVGIVIICVA